MDYKIVITCLFPGLCTQRIENNSFVVKKNIKEAKNKELMETQTLN